MLHHTKTAGPNGPAVFLTIHKEPHNKYFVAISRSVKMFIRKNSRYYFEDMKC